MATPRTIRLSTTLAALLLVTAHARAETAALTPAQVRNLDAMAAGLDGLEPGIMPFMLIVGLAELQHASNPACETAAHAAAGSPDKDYGKILKDCRVTCAGDVDALRKLPRQARLKSAIAACDKVHADELFVGPLAAQRDAFDAFEYVVVRELLGDARAGLKGSKLPAAKGVWPLYEKLLPRIAGGMIENEQTLRSAENARKRGVR